VQNLCRGIESLKVRFALDSALEEDGFEPLVPREIGSGFEAASGRFCDRFHSAKRTTCF
jgi:hypothetical protein